MAKGIEFTEGKGNISTHHDKDNGIFYVRIDLNTPTDELPVSKNSGATMMAKGFVNFTHDNQRIFGNINLNIGKNKSALKEENAELQAEIERLKAKLKG